MNKMGTIIGFTFKNKVRTKSFMITTLIIVLLLSIGMNIPYMIKVFQGDDSTSGAAGSGTQIGIVAETGNPAAELLKAYQPPADATKVTLNSYPSADDPELKKALDEEKIQGYLTLGAASSAGIQTVTYFSPDGKLKGEVQGYLQNALQQVNAQLIAGDKLTPEQISALNTPVQIGTQELGVGNGAEAEKSHPTINYVIVYVLLILFFMSIMMTGNMIAAEVTSEKSSRIMEILITSASPLAQMFGKVIGIFMVGLVQIAIIAAATAVNLTLPHNSTILTDFGLSFDQFNFSLLAYGLILYILGYFLFA
jgi:ABC-2 type transport system permease protein